MNLESAPTTHSNAKPSCSLCPTSKNCLIQGACQQDISAWNALVQNYVSLANPGKSLATIGEPANAIYVVRAGCLKSTTTDADGQEHVRGFHLPGDVIGMDALGSETNPCNVIAVVPSQVCRLPKSQALGLLATAPALMQKLLDRTSRELAQALTLAGDYTAEERVAAFLLSIQRRLATPSGVLRLPMPRRDVANYLRLAPETVCRVIARFEARGWMVSEDKKLTFKSNEGMRQAAAAMPMMMALAAA